MIDKKKRTMGRSLKKQREKKEELKRHKEELQRELEEMRAEKSQLQGMQNVQILISTWVSS